MYPGRTRVRAGLVFNCTVFRIVETSTNAPSEMEDAVKDVEIRREVFAANVIPASNFTPMKRIVSQLTPAEAAAAVLADFLLRRCSFVSEVRRRETLTLARSPAPPTPSSRPRPTTKLTATPAGPRITKQQRSQASNVQILQKRASSR